MMDPERSLLAAHEKIAANTRVKDAVDAFEATYVRDLVTPEEVSDLPETDKEGPQCLSTLDKKPLKLSLNTLLDKAKNLLNRVQIFWRTSNG